MQIEFLNRKQVLRIHEDQIARYGGEPIIRDEALLMSAIAMPQASFGGQQLHEFPHAMAAAYLFHIVQNHPFVDGNKRTGYASALMFLELNGFDLRANESEAVNLVLAVAQGNMDKKLLTEFFRDRVKS